MRNNSTSSISGVYAVSSTSAGRTRSRTPRCWRGHSSPASSPPCARHRHAGQVTYPGCQTPEYPNSCCTVNLVKGQGRQEDSGTRFKDSLKAYLKDFNIDVTTWENAASDRPAWRSMIHKGALHSEAQRSNAGQERREQKTTPIPPTLSGARPVAGASMPASLSSATSGHTAERS